MALVFVVAYRWPRNIAFLLPRVANKLHLVEFWWWQISAETAIFRPSDAARVSIAMVLL